MNPKALHIVLNGVTEDSRVLKCAWSLGNAGWEVLVLGSSPNTYEDGFEIGYAKVSRVPIKIVIQMSFLARGLRKIRQIYRKIIGLLQPKSEPAIPNLKRALKAITPIAIEFKPDVIHAHDYTALAVAGKLKEVLSTMGIEAKLIYDAHEFVPGVSHLTKPLANTYTKSELLYVPICSAVLSVSEGMSDLLIPYLKLKKRPEIIANDPLVEGQQLSKRNLRVDIGIGADIPLLVYSGAVAPARGVETVVAALREMPSVHLVVIANPKNQTLADLQAKYPDLRERFHVQPYVPNAELVSYLSSATIGLIPIVHKQNHEISLITKFGEYMQARLPMVVSDVRTMSAEVRKLGNGEVFIAEDVKDFVRATELVLANPQRYQERYTDKVLKERSWEEQAANLIRVYNEVSGLRPSAPSFKPFTVGEIKR